MPTKLALSVPAAEKAITNVKLGPKVLMSGYMTKRTRTMNMWKHRWWQLKDDGILYYYNPDGHPKKLLGQVDVGKTCYEVKMGSDTRIKFPRAVPSCCCFSFTVLRRVFYVYTPTPDETNSWVKAISGVSRVINRRIVAGLERKKAPEIPGGNHEFRVTRIKVNESGGPGLAGSCLDISKVQYLPLERNRLALLSKKKFAGSLPDYLDKVGIDEEEDSLVDSTEDTAVRVFEGSKEEEEKQVRAHQLQTFSMEDICSPRPLKRPVPTPRRRRDKSSKSTLTESSKSSASYDALVSGYPEADDAMSSITTPLSLSMDNISQLSHSSNDNLQLSPSLPPPLPPKGELDNIPPPPLTSPPHSRPQQSLPNELNGDISFSCSYFRSGEVAPISSPSIQPKQNAFQPVHSTEKLAFPQVSREIPKFIIPPPPPS